MSALAKVRRNWIRIGLLIGRKRLFGLSAVRRTAAICASVNGAYSVVPIKLFNMSLMIIVINRENWEIHTGHRGFDCFQKAERLSLIKFVKCVYVLNKDERVGVKDQATAVYIGRKIVSISF